MTEGVAINMLTSVTDALSTVLTWLSTVLTAVTGTDGALKDLWPLLAVGIAISVIMLTVRVVKRFAWGA